MPMTKRLPQTRARAPAIELEIEKHSDGARRVTIRIGMCVFVLLILIVANALGFDVQSLLRIVHFVR